DEVVKRIDAGRKRNKSSFIIIVAEGDIPGGAYEIAKQVTEKCNYFESRVTVIGHMQRGGNPTAFDRILASRLGVAATEGLIEGRKNEMAGLINNQIEFTPFLKTRKHLVNINEGLLNMAHMLGS
ncbi:MAG TPA: 6-phosphofructokinase, partial [Bacteroidia bacterium]|nr:6-phosphofructokinase [Bacteroidia bacterium]